MSGRKEPNPAPPPVASRPAPPPPPPPVKPIDVLLAEATERVNRACDDMEAGLVLSGASIHMCDGDSYCEHCGDCLSCYAGYPCVYGGRH